MKINHTITFKHAVESYEKWLHRKATPWAHVVQKFQRKKIVCSELPKIAMLLKNVIWSFKG